MQSKLTNLALVFAILALVVSAWGLTREEGAARNGPEPSGPPEGMAELERKVDRLTRELEELRALRPEVGGTDPSVAELADRAPESGEVDAEATGDRLQAMVDDAVEKKARSVTEKLRMKAEKKPPIDDFAKVLELSDAQRASIEREVIRGQHEAYSILETPTADGTNLMNDLVELVATSMANPGKDAGWGKWIGRVLTEKVPGTDETYATRIEAVKQSMRDNFREILSKEQYGEYETWRMDPLEIRRVPGSPGENLRLRIEARAVELGATLPEEDDK